MGLCLEAVVFNYAKRALAGNTRLVEKVRKAKKIATIYFAVVGVVTVLTALLVLLLQRA